MSEIWLETLSCGRCLFSASLSKTLRLHQLLGCELSLPTTENNATEINAAENNATHTYLPKKSTVLRKSPQEKYFEGHSSVNVYPKFPQQSLKYEHITVIDHRLEKPYKCNLCSFRCKRHSHIKSHVLIHTGEKPFSCDACDYKCNRADILKGHKIKHSTEKPFACSLCSYTCKSKIQLTKHKLVHTDEKLFTCDICNYKCNHHFRLKVHKLTHSNKKPIACSMCHYSCKTPRYLKLHCRAMHPDAPSEKPAV